MLKIKIQVKTKEDIELTIEGSPINEVINDHFAEMNGGV